MGGTTAPGATGGAGAGGDDVGAAFMPGGSGMVVRVTVIVKGPGVVIAIAEGTGGLGGATGGDG